jgi:hypothetical protein
MWEVRQENSRNSRDLLFMMAPNKKSSPQISKQYLLA